MDKPFEMFIGKREPDIEVSAWEGQHVGLAVGNGYVALDSGQAMDLVDALLGAVHKVDGGAILSRIREQITSLQGGVSA